MKQIMKVTVAGVLGLTMLVGGTHGLLPSETPSTASASKIKVTTVKYKSTVDGDTFKFVYKNKTYTADLLLVDAPSYDKSGTYKYGKESAVFLQKKLKGAKKLQVNFDKTGNKVKNGKVKVYVYADGKDVNVQLVNNGYARVVKQDKTNIRNYNSYVNYQTKAKKVNKRIWSINGYVTSKGYDKNALVKPPSNNIGNGSNQQPPVIEEDLSNINPSDYLDSPSAFNYYLKKNIVADKVIKGYQINTSNDMISLVKEMYGTLPKKIELTSKYYSGRELESMFDTATGYYKANTTPVKIGLTLYYSRVEGNKLIIEDNAHPVYNAATIKKASDIMAKDLATKLKGSTEKQTITNVYDYLYKNFKYNASGNQKMRIGNFGTGEMACNGFSYISKVVLEQAGLKTEIREGTSHYWNIVTLSNGERVTFDVTTDNYLGDYKATLGASTIEHIATSKRINIFNADFIGGMYDFVGAVDMSK